MAREIVGYETAAVSRTYSHIDMAILRGAIDKLPDLMSGTKSRRIRSRNARLSPANAGGRFQIEQPCPGQDQVLGDFAHIARG